MPPNDVEEGRWGNETVVTESDAETAFFYVVGGITSSESAYIFLSPQVAYTRIDNFTLQYHWPHRLSLFERGYTLARIESATRPKPHATDPTLSEAEKDPHEE